MSACGRRGVPGNRRGGDTFSAGTFSQDPSAEVSALNGTIGTQSVTLTRQWISGDGGYVC
jgi:hypothetical protein